MDINIKNILILDDDKDYRKLIKTLLGKYFPDAEFHEYDPVTEGAPADDFNWSKYDVLILDYYLCVHKLTGLDLLHKHHKKPGFPATIMLTGAANEETAIRALDFGVHEFLRKDTLDKEVMAEAIINVYRKHIIERKKQALLDKTKNLFSKSKFYKKLERAEKPDNDTPEHVFLLIDIDNFNSFSGILGPIGHDNLVRYVGKISFALFRVKQNNPSITRFGCSSIGLLIDYPKSTEKLGSILHELCSFLSENPYKFDEDSSVAYTVSIGVLHIHQNNNDVDMLVKQAHKARDIARQVEGNSYHLYTGTEIIESQLVEPGEVNVSAVATTGTDGLNSLEKPEITESPIIEQAEITQTELEQFLSKIKEIPLDTLSEAAESVLSAKVKNGNGESDKLDEALDNNISTNGSGLDNDSLKIKNAFENNLGEQTFQPIISLFTSDTENLSELIKVDIQLVDIHGNIMPTEELRSQISSLSLQRFIDRWMLRELIGRIVRSTNKDTQNMYLLTISEAWFTDITLFSWLKMLLNGLDIIRPGQYITLQISAKSFIEHKGRALVLITSLKKLYGFQVALANINDADEAIKIAKSVKFNLLTLDTKSITDKKVIDLLNYMKEQETRIVIDGIEDATILNEAMSVGADYVMGTFIGEPQSQLQGLSNVESFEIT